MGVGYVVWKKLYSYIKWVGGEGAQCHGMSWGRVGRDDSPQKNKYYKGDAGNAILNKKKKKMIQLFSQHAMH